MVVSSKGTLLAARRRDQWLERSPIFARLDGRFWRKASLDCTSRVSGLEVRLGSWSCQNGLGMSPGSQSPAVFQPAIAAINGLTPMMFMTRVRL